MIIAARDSRPCDSVLDRTEPVSRELAGANVLVSSGLLTDSFSFVVLALRVACGLVTGPS
jgi:hypothetical protein